MIIIKTLLTLSLLTTFQPINKQYAVFHTPKIISIDTEFPKEGNWIIIPKGTKKITFTVKAKNTETVLFWLIPTGTQTWKERKLIGYDIKKNDNDNEFSLIWDIDRPFLHDHLHIQALGNGEGISNEIINLSMGSR